MQSLYETLKLKPNNFLNFYPFFPWETVFEISLKRGRSFSKDSSNNGMNFIEAVLCETL